MKNTKLIALLLVVSAVASINTYYDNGNYHRRGGVVGGTLDATDNLVEDTGEFAEDVATLEPVRSGRPVRRTVEGTADVARGAANVATLGIFSDKNKEERNTRRDRRDRRRQEAQDRADQRRNR